MSFTKNPGFQRELSRDPYVSRGSFAQRVQIQNNTQFDEVLTSTRTPIIELNSSYGTSALRDIETTTGSGSISSSSGEISLSTGTTASSSAKLESAEVGRYIPGYGTQLGIGVRIPSGPSGNAYAKWGGLSQDDSDGFYFGKDSSGVFVAVLKNGVESKVRQENWNIDSLDGGGPSGYNLDTSNGNIYQIDFTWYGYGQILFSVVAIPPLESGESVDEGYKYNQATIPVHSFRPSQGVSVESPNLQVFAETNNGGDASDFSTYVGGRQYSVIGTYVPKYRFTADFRGSESTSTSVIPLVSFRRKTNFGDRSVKVQGFDSIQASEPHVVELRVGGTLTGASFGTPTNHSSTETALESDTSATAISGGQVVWQQLVPAGSGNQAELGQASVDFDVPNGSVLTLCARTVSGTGSIVSQLRMREEW